ncbi:hypothetical protein [Streptomyces sp. C]|uniref:hypothetical protein n=1 Tax=Streptomyces sp. C TaxID=253839 RepID=UPI0001B56C70|nr:hypothetical protein [Streptomyces sp. C]
MEVVRVDSFRLLDIVVDGQSQQVGRIAEMPEGGDTLKLVRPPGETTWTARREECWYASEEEAAVIVGEVVERVISGRNEKPLLPRRKG